MRRWNVVFLAISVLPVYPDLAVSSNIRLLDDGSVECISSLEPNNEPDYFYARRSCNYIGNSCVKGTFVIYPKWRDGLYVEEAHEHILCATSLQLPELCAKQTRPGPLFPDWPQVTSQNCGYKTTNDGIVFMEKYVCTEVLRIPNAPYHHCPLGNMRVYQYYTSVKR